MRTRRAGQFDKVITVLGMVHVTCLVFTAGVRDILRLSFQSIRDCSIVMIA